MIRRGTAVSLSVAAACVVASVRSSAPIAVVPASAGYVAPVAGPIVVVRPFQPPPTRYAAGHRGADLAVGGDRSVRAAQSGIVRFAGAVGGRGVVVIVHGDGVRTEYEPVVASVAEGALVRRGEVIGSVAGAHRHCAAGTCLHWGAQRDGHYIDPMTLLAPLGVVRLLPWDEPPKPDSVRALPQRAGLSTGQARG